MSSPAANTHRGLSVSLLQVLALLLVMAVLVGAGRLVPSSTSEAGLAAALGLLLLGGVLGSEVLELIKLPHLTGYLAAGVLAGPHVLHLIDHQTVVELSEVNTLALALIALAGGLELKVSTLREVARSLYMGTLLHTLAGVLLTGATFLLLRRWIPFAAELSLSAALGVALLWGVLAVSRSPSATLGILSQTKADGPLTKYSLAFVMSSDIVVVTMMAGALVIARPLLIPGALISPDSLSHLAQELYGSVTVGTTLGLLLAVYLRFVGRSLIIVLVFLGYGFTAGVRYLHLEPLLTFIVAGFVVQNLSQQGDRLLSAIERTGAIVFVVFFATAGAHLDLPLLAELWPVAVSLAVARAAATIGLQSLSSRLVGDSIVLRRFGWTPLISQAGLTLGLSVVIEREFADIGVAFRSLIIATVALNEMVGPVLFKWGLERTGETGRLGQET